MSEEQKNEAMAVTDDAAPIKDRVTLEIVRSTIGEGDPNQWSAQKLLETIGSGSKRTHQKYLDAVRTEYARAALPQLGESDVVPAMPKDLGDAFWRQAWTMAISKSATYITQLTLQRDALKVQLETAQADIESHLDSSEVAEERLRKALLDTAASAEIAEIEKVRADKAMTELEELKTLSEKNLADQMAFSEDACKALSRELEHAKQHTKEQLELAEKNAQLLLKGLQEVNSQQAQRELDLRNQIADANRRADESNRRADNFAEKLAGQILKTNSSGQPGVSGAGGTELGHLGKDQVDPAN